MNKVFIVTETVMNSNDYLRFEIVGVYETYELANQHAKTLTKRAKVLNAGSVFYTYDIEEHELKCAKCFENN